MASSCLVQEPSSSIGMIPADGVPHSARGALEREQGQAAQERDLHIVAPSRVGAESLPPGRSERGPTNGVRGTLTGAASCLHLT
jgi:hypothetical protein